MGHDAEGRLALYKHVAGLVRAYADLANELPEAGYSAKDIGVLTAEVGHYEKVRNEVKLASGDYIDLKMYEPAMRHLIDTYIRAEESEKVSAFDDLSLVQLIVERGADAVKSLPEGIRKSKEAVAEAIENNMRRLIIDEQPINPKYYEKMSELLDALIAQRRAGALDYQKYLEKIVELAKKLKDPTAGGTYPKTMNTPARRALYDNLGKNEALALQVDQAVQAASQDDWRSNPFKVKKLRGAIKIALQMHQTQSDTSVVPLKETYKGKSGDPENPLVDEVLNLVKNQREY